MPSDMSLHTLRECVLSFSEINDALRLQCLRNINRDNDTLVELLEYPNILVNIQQAEHNHPAQIEQVISTVLIIDTMFATDIVANFSNNLTFAQCDTICHNIVQIITHYDLSKNHTVLTYLLDNIVGRYIDTFHHEHVPNDWCLQRQPHVDYILDHLTQIFGLPPNLFVYWDSNGDGLFFTEINDSV